MKVVCDFPDVTYSSVICVYFLSYFMLQESFCRENSSPMCMSHQNNLLEQPTDGVGHHQLDPRRTPTHHSAMDSPDNPYSTSPDVSTGLEICYFHRPLLQFWHVLHLQKV